MRTPTEKIVVDNPQDLKPIWTMPTPGEPNFHTEFDRAKEICYRIPRGAKLVYIGPDDWKFVNFHRLMCGEIVTVLGRVPCKVGVHVLLSDGEPTALNLCSLAYIATRYYGG